MNADDKVKGNEKSGGNYPYCPLNLCLTIAEAVKALGGVRAPVSKALLASHLKEDESSQVLAFKLAASKSFGLIHGRMNYALTGITQHYFYPTSTSDRKNALLDALVHSPAFKMLVERFDGNKLPSPDILSNILHRDGGVPESWKDRVAGIFAKSALVAGALDKEGFLRVKVFRESNAARKDDLVEKPNVISVPDATTRQSVEQSSPDDLNVAMPKDETVHHYVLPLPNKRKVVLVAPLDINKAEIFRLQKWIEFTLLLDWKDEAGP